MSLSPRLQQPSASLNRPAPASGGFRVAVIGGGPAGLSAAHLLEERGAGHVTVFEADTRLGGKSCSVRHEGTLHEMGTCYSTLDHNLTNRWMRALGIRQVPVGDQRFEGAPFIDYLRAGPGRPLALEFAQYCLAWRGFMQRASQTGHDAAFAAEAAQPIAAWLDTHKFIRMRRFMLRAITIMGYGHLDEVSTLQALRWCTPGLFLSGGLKRGLRMPECGWQGFWERLAEGKDVRLGNPVLAVDRSAAGIEIVSAQGAELFDAVVVTIPMDAFLKLTHATGSETFVAEAIDWGSYATTLARVKNWFRDYNTDAFAAALEPGAEAGSLLAARRAPAEVAAPSQDIASDLYLCGQYGGGLSQQELRSRLSEAITAQGGEILSILEQRNWRYFPRYKPAAIRSGLVTRMAEMQGERGTWYSGASFSHEAVSNITRFNVGLAERIAAHAARQRSVQSR